MIVKSDLDPAYVTGLVKLRDLLIRGNCSGMQHSVDHE
jgi:hypothetical protein